MTNGVYLNVTKLKGGKKLPYLRVCAGPQRDEYVHRLIAEALMRRPLKPHETVDHKDQNSLNCHPCNIQVLSWSDHGKLSNARRKDGVEYVDYEIIFDGEKVFQTDESSSEQGSVPTTEGATVR